MGGVLTAAIAAAFSGSAVTPDPYYEYTTLLLPGNGTNGAQNNTFLDGSTNNFTITRNGNTTQGTFSPFSQTGWGNYFAGATNNSITVATGSGYAFGAGDFCEEFFCYANSYPSNWRILSAQTSSVVDILQSSGAVLGVAIAGGAITNTGFTLSTSTWFHLVVTRQSNTIRVFIDGVLRYNVSNSTNFSTSQSVYIGGFPGFTQSWDGYISNARIIKGSVPTAYQTSSTTNGTTIFTPPTSPLTAVTGTELLTCQSNRFFDSNTQVTAKTITVTGSPSVVAFSPFNPTASWSAATYGGSGYFDGSTDYLNIASNSAFDLTGDYTVECWFYANSFPSQPALFGIGSDTAGLVITISSSKVYAYIFNVGNTFGSGGTTLTTNSWNHIAVVRSGTTNTCYINGSQSGTTYSSSSTVSSTGGVGIGRTVAGTSFNDWNGYISNFRIVKGTAVYTAAFTPPTAPLTAITNTSLLLNFTNAGIYDATSKNDLETVGNAQISTAQSKWGGSSMLFNGTTDYLSTLYTTQLNLGTSDFTIEAWFNTNSVSGARGIVGIGNVGTGSTGIIVRINNNTVQFWVNGYNTPVTGSGTIVVGTWYYVALVRSGSTNTLYVNGTSVASNSATPSIGSPTVAVIGRTYSDTSAEYFSGYIQDVRITKGYARTITASPTSAFPTL